MPKRKNVVGYKVFDNNFSCQGFKYEVGKTYTHEGKIDLCESGFHFCETLEDCLNYYPLVQWSRFAKVEAVGKVIKGINKNVTNKIKIIKELSFTEVIDILASTNINFDGVNYADGVGGSHGVSSSIGVSYSQGVDDSYGVYISHGVSDSKGVNDSDGVNNSDGVNISYGVNCSRGVDNSSGVSESNGVNISDGVDNSDGVSESNGVSDSCGVNISDGVHNSCGVNISDGVNCSRGVDDSHGVNNSHGVSESCGVDDSHGVKDSSGIVNSFGIYQCKALSDCLFCMKIKAKQYYIFNKKVTKERFDEISLRFFLLIETWRPTYNNLNNLCLKSDERWAYTPIPEAEELSIEEAWADMPTCAVNFLKALPEFNASIFKQVTGIEV